MPTARELLEQADALMRRNRGGGDSSIPVLTEPVPDAPELPLGPSTRERTAFPPAGVEHPDGANAAEARDLSLDLDRSLQDGGEPPVLTDVVEELAVDLVPLPSARLEEDWLGADTVDPELQSITGPSPDTFAAVPPMALQPTPHVSVPAAEPVETTEEPAPPMPPAAESVPTPAPMPVPE